MNYTGLRILHVAAVDFTIHRFVAPLMRWQAERGASVAAFGRAGESAEALEAAGIRFIDGPMSRRARPMAQARALAALWSTLRRERPDIVHCHTPLAGLAGRLAGALAGIPLRLYTVHGFHFHEGSTRLAAAAFRTAERLGSAIGHDLLFVSREDLAAARAMALRPADQLHWVGNGVELAPRCAAPVPTRADLGIPPDAVVVGYVGRFVREKGLEELAAAFADVAAENPRLHLLAVGGRLASDADDALPAWSALASTPGFRGRVHLPGLVDDARAWLPLMDMFVLPSYREGLPVSLMEAMAAGRCCIATRIRGSRELIADGANGALVEPRGIEPLAAALRHLAATPADRAALGASARTTIAAGFTREEWLERHDLAYSSAWRRVTA